MKDEILRALAELEASHAMRRPRVIERVRGATVTVDGRDVVSFCSNDYLGLSQDRRIGEAASRAAEEFGWGSGSSRLLGGTTTWHARLEERFAAFKREPAALAFPSGYTANIGLLTSIADERTLIASDELNHASIIDACRLSRAKVEKYRHADPADAARALRADAERKLLVTDTVFSMDGDIAPLPELLRVADAAKAQFVIDDAHATGVLGAGGRGALEHFGLEGRGIIQTATLSKSAGASGGVVLGSHELKQLLVNRARAFIFTTASPPADAAAGVVGVELMEQAHDARRRLRERIAQLASALGVRAETPVIPVELGSNERALEASAKLWERGLFVPAIRPPTVPHGRSRLRISLTALHEPQHVNSLVEGLRAILAR